LFKQLRFLDGVKSVQKSFSRNGESWLYITACILYLLGVWEHSSGNIYTDIVGVFVNRFCTPEPCMSHGLPYINFFVEYPPLTGFFMYAMGTIAHVFPFPGRGFLVSYYDYTSIFLLFPTLLLISDLLKISDVIGIREKYKISILFLVATPSFVFMLLLNWYIIGVFLMVWGLRKFLERDILERVSPKRLRGNLIFSGMLFGLSAASNLVTAVPALGILIFGTRSWKERSQFLFGILAALLGIYLPLIALNSVPHNYLNAQHVLVSYQFYFPNLNVITDFTRYEQNWYTEGSWMLAFFSSTDPIRHYIFPALFAVLSIMIVLKGLRMEKQFYSPYVDRSTFVLMMCSLFTFAFLFSTYVCTPQMNLVLLPFFVLIPLLRRNYGEFLAFEIVNSLVIVWGFSYPLSFLGINTPTPVEFGSIWSSPIQFLVVVRSFWIGKFLIYDGLIKWRTSSKTIESSKELLLINNTLRKIISNFG